MASFREGAIRALPAALFAAALSAPARAQDGPDFDVYGFAQVDYIQDFRRVNPAWEATLRPSRIPTQPDEFGSNGQALLSARQSRLGVVSNLPLGSQELHTKFEFDMFGVGVDEGQTTIRLRHAYGEWGPILGGQTHSLFMDIDAFPNVIDYWGPCGMVFLRLPQIRFTPVNTDMWRVAVAAEQPSNDLDPGQLREIDPELGAAVRGDEIMPDFTAQIRVGDDETWGHVQVAGIVRYLGYETLGTDDLEPNGHDWGWGVDLTTNFRFLEEKLILSAVYGHGIASYMNDGGVDLAPGGTTANPEGQAVPLFGGMAYLDHTWTERWTSTLGYAFTWVDNREFQQGNAFRLGQYASANVIFSPHEDWFVGLEGLWGSRLDKDDDDGWDIRTQLTVKYNFSMKRILPPPPQGQGGVTQ